MKGEKNKMFYIPRYHMIPDEVDVDKIIEKYQESIEENGILMTSVDMNYWIRRRYRKLSNWSDCLIHVEIENEEVFLRSTCSETMDLYWKQYVPDQSVKNICGRISWKKGICCICRNDTLPQFKLDSCGCTFHRHCILKAVQYRQACPICQTTINVQVESKNATGSTAKTAEKKEETSSL